MKWLRLMLVTDPTYCWTMERIKPGEGGLAAAVRVLRKVGSRNNRYCDIICADAFYEAAPFVKEVLYQHENVVIGIKQEDRALIKDMDGLIVRRALDVSVHGMIQKGKKGKDVLGANCDLKTWNQEDFTS